MDQPSADRQKEDAGGGELIEEVHDLSEGHFGVIDVAAHAVFVAVVVQIKLRVERDAKAHALAPISCINERY